MLGRVWWVLQFTPNTADVHTLFYVVLHCHAGLLHCPQDPNVYSECHNIPVAPESFWNTVQSLFCHEEKSGKQWHPWCHMWRSPSIWLGKDSDGISGSLEIWHVDTLQTDISVLVCMPWSKIHRQRLFMTRIVCHPAASMQDGWSILHNTPTFELSSGHGVPTTLRFCIGAAHYTKSCGRCVSRCHLPSLTPVTSIVYLHSWAAWWWHIPGLY